MIDKPAPEFLWTLFRQLRRRHFPLSHDDYEALRQALQAGFGWASRDKSRDALRELCVMLWAKSKDEQETLESLFDQFQIEPWDLPELEEGGTSDFPQELSENQGLEKETPEALEPIVTAKTKGSLPPIVVDNEDLPESHFVLVPQFPLSYREVAQAWRRMRQPVRQGAPVELDIEGTIQRRCRQGVCSEIALMPRRVNTARLLLLIDCQGSMTPFSHFVDEVVAAIQQSGRLEQANAFYFHDVPVEGTNKEVLAPLSDQLYPALDKILHDIQPCSEGFVFDTADLLAPQSLSDVLKNAAENAAVVIISDAGAAKKNYDIYRLLDTVAFLKAIKLHSAKFVWLNPLPREDWADSSAGQIARHAPMFCLNGPGLHHAVNLLRGQVYTIERPL